MPAPAKKDTLAEVKYFLQKDIKRFKEIFDEVFKSHIPLLNTVLKYIIKQKGKQIRPLLVLLSARIFGTGNPSSLRAASLIELLHTATLIHDDVVDDATKRRGIFSLKTVWKNKIAVLAGDYLLARGMLLTLENKEYDMLEILSKSVKEMSEGELLQLETSRKDNIDEDVYIDIIQKKTASLFAACCACGCASNSDDTDMIETMWEIGTELGIIFQIQDDVLDVIGSKSGKDLYTDLKESKNTLPIIYTLKTLSDRNRKKVRKLLRIKKKDTKTIETILHYIEHSGGMYAVQTEIERRKKNLMSKVNLLPKNEASLQFRKMIEYIIGRTS